MDGLNLAYDEGSTPFSGHSCALSFLDLTCFKSEALDGAWLF